MLCYLPGVIIPTIPPTPQQFTCPLLMPVLSPVKKHSFRGVGTTCIRQWMYIDFKRRIIVAHQPPIKLLCGLIEVWVCSALGHSIKHTVVTLPFACSEPLTGDLLPSVHKVPAVRRIAAVLYRRKGITPSQHPQSSTVCESWFVKAVPQPDCWAPVQAPLRNSLHPESKDVLNYCVIACIMLLWQTNPSSIFLLPPINTYGTKIISQKQHERSF